MKIVALHRYFWPQPYPYAQMLKDIVFVLSGSGHTVTVVTTDSGLRNEQSNRSEWSRVNSVDIRTLPLGSEKRAGLVRKSANAIFFAVWSIWQLIVTRPDVVLVATTPPIVMAMIVRLMSRFLNFKYVYHCQDIHPEAMLLGGSIKNGIMYKFLRAVDRKNVNAAWKVITLSDDMRYTLEKRGCDTSHVSIINNFVFEEGKALSPFNSLSQKTEFLFAGSLGRLQNLEVIMRAICLLKMDTDIVFTIMGDGVMFREMLEIKKLNDLDNVEFLGQRSIAEAVEAMHKADVGIVSLAPDICGVAYPSKTMMYLGNGLPVFAIVDGDSSLHDYINSNELGMSVSHCDATTIADSIKLLARKLQNSPANRKHISEKARLDFGKERVLAKHVELYL